MKAKVETLTSNLNTANAELKELRGIVQKIEDDREIQIQVFAKAKMQKIKEEQKRKQLPPLQKVKAFMFKPRPNTPLFFEDSKKFHEEEMKKTSILNETKYRAKVNLNNEENKNNTQNQNTMFTRHPLPSIQTSQSTGAESQATSQDARSGVPVLPSIQTGRGRFVTSETSRGNTDVSQSRR